MSSLLIIQIISALLGTLALLFVSRNSLLRLEKHGFYRFFVFEFCLLIILLNIPFWFSNPFYPLQIISWILLIASLYLVFGSIYYLKKFGGNKERENEASNFNFENTNYLVKNGIYKYIRHPMYSSLLFLSLGAFLKNVSLFSLFLILAVVIFLNLTAKTEEKENIKYFGISYSEYMKETKMFVPFIL